MILIKQVFRDLIKEAGWVIFYGFLTAMAIMAFILIALSYQYVNSQNDAIQRFTKNNVSMVQVKDTNFLRTSDPERLAQTQRSVNVNTIKQNFAEMLDENKNVGSLAMLGGKYGYKQVVIYMGSYNYLTAFPIQTNFDTPVIAVSPDCAEDAGSTLRIGDFEYTINVVPTNMDIYHPLNYIPPSSENLTETLYLFMPSYEYILAAFPELTADIFIDRLIIATPTEQDIINVRTFLYQNFSAYAEIQPIESYLTLTAAGSTRTHQAYLLFYIMASIVLFSALLLNSYRILRRRVSEYAIHHLFGATQLFIFARMYLFVLGYHAIPFFGTLLIMSLNKLASPLNIIIVFTATICTTFFITIIVQKIFVSEFSQGLRRE